MIKSLLDDDGPKDEADESGGGFLRKRRSKQEFLSIDLSEDESPPEGRVGESADELQAAFRGVRSEQQSDPPPPGVVPLPASTAGDTSGLPAEDDFSARAVELEKKLKEIEEELRREKARHSDSGLREPLVLEVPGTVAAAEPEPQEVRPRPEIRVPFDTSAKDDFVPESLAESFRNSSLAWSAGIALFGSVVFMLVLGWFADLLIGSSPWGIVTGIVIGSVVGFIQFFRITSQILRPGKSDFEKVSLKSASDGNGEETPDNGPGPGFLS